MTSPWHRLFRRAFWRRLFYLVRLAVRSAWRPDVSVELRDGMFASGVRIGHRSFPRVTRGYLRRDPCAYCGGPGGTVDHIRPSSQDGEDHWRNLAGSCRSCNSQKGSGTMLAFLVSRLEQRRPVRVSTPLTETERQRRNLLRRAQKRGVSV